jgi:hypothetical protein
MDDSYGFIGADGEHRTGKSQRTDRQVLLPEHAEYVHGGVEWPIDTFRTGGIATTVPPAAGASA